VIRKNRRRRSESYLERIRRRRRIGEDIADLNRDVDDRRTRKTRRADDMSDREWRKVVRDEEEAESDGMQATDVEDQAEEPRRFPRVDRAETDPARRLNTGYNRRRGVERRRARNENRDTVRNYRKSRRSRRRKFERTKIDEPRDFFFDEESLEELTNKAFNEINEAMKEKAEINEFRELVIKEAHALPNKNLSLKSKLITENSSKNLEICIEGMMKVIDDEGIFECYINDKDEELFEKDSTVKVEIKDNKLSVLSLGYKTYVESVENEKSHLVEGNVNLTD